MIEPTRVIYRVAAIAAFAGTVLAGVLLHAASAYAQGAAPQMKVDPCDDTHYPVVSCSLAPVDAAGMPLRNLTLNHFSIVDDGTVVSPTTLLTYSVPVSYMLVVDFGISTVPQQFQKVYDLAVMLLNSARNEDAVGLIGADGEISFGGDMEHPTINIDAKEFGFVNAGSKRTQLINDGLHRDPPQAAKGTPLYDALCKGLRLTNSAEVGARAVIVISDGQDGLGGNSKDGGSSKCQTDAPGEYAAKQQIPIFAIGFLAQPQPAIYLESLTRPTGIGLIDATSASTQSVQTQFINEIQSALGLRYLITFTATTPADNQEHNLAISVTGEKLAIVKVRARTVEPVVTRAPTQIPQATNTNGPISAPATQTAADSQTTSDGNSMLKIGVIVLAVTLALQLIVLGVLIYRKYIRLPSPAQPQTQPSQSLSQSNAAPTPAVRAAPKPRPAQRSTVVPIDDPPASAVQARGDAPMPLEDLPTVMPHHTEPDPEDEAKTRVPGASAGAAMADDETPSGATHMFKLRAILELTNGRSKGARYRLGVPGIPTVLIGRAVNEAQGHVRVESEFVSRKHAQIVIEPTAMFLEDLGSAVGTQLNGQRLLGRHELHVGDRVEFADVFALVQPPE